MRGLDMVANAAVLTLLTAVCSIPLVTIGPRYRLPTKLLGRQKKVEDTCFAHISRHLKETSQLQRPYGQCSPQLD